jgi:ribonuclease D
MIQTEAALKDIVQRAIKAPQVALDTEFFWERTFYPILGVVQIGFSSTECYLIDAVALPTLPHFGELLAHAETEKLLHDAQQDLAILSRITGAPPQNIFDSRRAAGFAGLPSTISLAALLRDVLDVEIPKTETRSNWLRRPLTQNQIAYALNDVRFLPELRQALITRATELGNQHYLREEMRILDGPDFYREFTPLEVFQRMKNGRLRGQHLVLLLELVRFREAVARARDIPRAHVLRDTDLQELAQRAPASISDINRIQALPRGTAQRYGDAILKAIQTGQAASGLPKGLKERPERLSRELRESVDLRIRAMRDAATKEGVDPALVASKAGIIALMAAERATPKRDHALMHGWRKRFVT